MPDKGPIRVLSIVGGSVHGGVELWMLDVLRHIDRDRFDLDIVAFGDASVADYDKAVSAMGARLFHCPWHCGAPGELPYVGFARRFKRFLQEHGPYDVVHDSVDARGLAVTMAVARQAGVPVRIAHAHSVHHIKAYSSVDLALRLKYYATKALFPLPVVLGNLTHILGVSSTAAVELFGIGVLQDSRYLLSPSGIDLSSFDPGVTPSPMRASLGLDDTTRVVGHLGRFAEVKNHEFWVRVAAEVARRRQDVAFVLVGDGPLQGQVENQVQQAGLSDRFRFLGFRADVADVMRGAMDVVLFPSKSEGMGRVVIEAQAAGLPCIISDVIPPEVDILPALVQRRSLADLPGVWADAVINALDRPPEIAQSQAFASVAASPFNIVTNVQVLEGIYESSRRPSDLVD